MTEEIMTRIGEAAGTYSPGTFMIGRDFREHGAHLEEAFVSGLKKTGSNANLVGTCPASLCVFANWKMRNDVTAYITASHLSAQWNGVKFFHQDGVGFSFHDSFDFSLIKIFIVGWIFITLKTLNDIMLFTIDSPYTNHS